MKTFQETIKIGGAGERITFKVLNDRGVTIYAPFLPDQSNVIDGIGITSKNKLIFLEVKTYPRRFLKSEQGLDKADLIKYIRLIKQYPDICFVLCFVDPFEGKILALNLSAHYNEGKIEGAKVYYPLRLTKPIYNLTSEELLAIGWHDERYRGVKRFFE